MTRTTKWRLLGVLIAAAVIVTLPFTVPFRRWVFDFLPLLVLLACPLIHLVMHRHHGARHQPSDQRAPHDVQPGGPLLTPGRYPRRANRSGLASHSALPSAERK
jgi:hypothetical protein